MWLRIAIRYSVARIAPNYVVHELKNVPMAPEWRRAWTRNGYERLYYDSAARKSECGVGTPWKLREARDTDSHNWVTQCRDVKLIRDPSFGEVADGR